MRDARTADIEESIVAELIMVGGLDATLVGPLERIQPDSTDRLCLSGFTQDLALLSWMSVEDAARWWQELDLTGIVVPLSLDGSAGLGNGSAVGRRIFYIQLSADSIPTQVCKQLKSRLDLLRVQPVSLQLNMKSPVKSLPGAASGMVPSTGSLPVISKPTVSLPTVSLPTSTLPASTLPANSVQATDGASKPVSAGASKLRATADEVLTSEDEWQNLDQLVDDLDELDL